MPKSNKAASNGAASIPSADLDLSQDDYAGLLIDRLASTIIDDSLPLKEVERDLRGSVAEVAIKKRGLAKRETANRCGVTEKSIENYLKEARNNPKSPEREVARALQDEMLTLEEVYSRVSPVLSPTRNFTLDDAKRALDKLTRTGEIQEYPGPRYRAVERPAIRYPATVDGHRELVDQKARDLDYIVLRQKEASEEDLGRRDQRYSRVVGDSNLVRIDFTVDVDEENLPAFYEKLSEAIAKITMKEEKKKGKSRVRLLLAMRSVMGRTVGAFVLLLTMALLAPAVFGPADAWSEGVRPDGDDAAADPGPAGNGERGRSWELDRQNPEVVDNDKGDPAAADDDDDVAGGAASLDDEGDFDVGVEENDDEEYRPNPVKGDANLDTAVDFADALVVIRYVQFGGETPACEQAGDIDENRVLELWDGFFLLRHIYLGDSLNIFDRAPAIEEPRGQDAPVVGERPLDLNVPEDEATLGCETLHV